MRPEHRLTRSRDRVLAGVLGGFAEQFDVEPTWVRLGYAVVTVLTGIVVGALVYGVLTLIMHDPAPRRG